jgi:hypothetical protein
MNREKNVENTIELHLTRDRPMVSDTPKIKNNFNEKGPLPIDKNKDEKREKRKERDRIAAKFRRQKNNEINKEKRTALDRMTLENEKLNGKIEKLKTVRNQLEIARVLLNFDIEMENMWSETKNTVGEEEKRAALDRMTSENEILNGKIELLNEILNGKLDIQMENVLSETIYTVGEEVKEITATSECRTLILVMFI